MRFVTRWMLRSRALPVSLTVLVLATLIAGCGSDEPSTAPGAPAAVLAANDTEVRANQRIGFNLLNTGAVPLRVRACVVEVQRSSAGAWASVATPSPWAACGEAERTVAPENSLEMSLYVPPALAAGVYRIACDVEPVEQASGGTFRVYSTSFIVLG